MVKPKAFPFNIISHTLKSSPFLYAPSKKLMRTSGSRLFCFSVPPLPSSSNFKRPLSLSLPCSTFSSTSTRYPLQYEMIISHPAHSEHANPRQTRVRPSGLGGKPVPEDSPGNENEIEEVEEERPAAESGGFESWVDRKLASEKEKHLPEMDKAKRKYFSKRRKRMYGSDSEEENRKPEDNFVELKPEVVEFPTLHMREEELYFHDAFAFPWEKEKHYKMVYQLEKKYFPDQCLDKAFLEPGQTNVNVKKGREKTKKKEEVGDIVDDNKLVFFEEKSKKDLGKESGKDVTERKVEEFFKSLKKDPNKDVAVNKGEPYLATRSTGLPPTWDGPFGTVVLVNKPKGWTSFTVCGKLRRLVKVTKVGHAGTLDPMATGLLIVCVGKATKLVERYQHMIKGYSGVFRLGEATSTLDADSPVIQREPWEHIRDEDIRKTALSFCGDIWQVPPMFSAIKVGGEKMYEKARRGESVELSPRQISIFQFDIERSLENRQNLIFRVICSKGTYIRSLCADLGKALGSCAHLTALRRDSIGEYSADDAWDFKELEAEILKNYL